MVRICKENCDIQGFNINIAGKRHAQLKVRIGIIADDQNNCKSCKSCSSFDTSVRETTCGNVVICNKPDNKNIAAFSYIFVQ